MSVDVTPPLEQLVTANRLDWMLLRFATEYKQALVGLRKVLQEAAVAARRRLGEAAPDFSDDMLWEWHEKNPHKVAALLQAISATQNPEMLVLAWRLLQGAEILSLSLNYQSAQSFCLRVELSPALDDAPDVYESSDIVDATLLRHLGIVKVNGQPVFEGFYALRLQDVNLSPRRDD